MIHRSTEPFPLDPYFDFQEEANTPDYEYGSPLTDKYDSDRWSPTLQKYHQLLWSKSLPDGRQALLVPSSQNRLEMHVGSSSILLSSDRAVPSFLKRKKVMAAHDLAGEERVAEFHRLADTMGGIIIWPSQKVGPYMTINGQRGFHGRIADRLDLTLECVRRYYSKEESPLSATLGRYSNYFDLFSNFSGYVNFFLFQDWVSSDYSTVKSALPIVNFERSGLPKTASEHISYMNKSEEMVRARNERISEYVANMEPQST